MSGHTCWSAWLLLAVVVAITVALPAEQQVADYFNLKSCRNLLKDERNCKCWEAAFTCGTMHVTADTDEQSILIQCGDFSEEGLNELPSLKLGNTSELMLRNCDMPQGKEWRQQKTRLGLSHIGQLKVSISFSQIKRRIELLHQRCTKDIGLSALQLNGYSKRLPANFLENCTTLTDLELWDYSDIPSTLLQPLVKLRRLKILVRNMANVASELFANQTELRELYLDCGLTNSSVEMSTLTSEELWHMPHLRQVVLQNCGDNFPTELFWKSPALNYLSINSNISYVGKDFLKAQQELLELRLVRNNIARLPDELFKHTTKLQEIHLTHNNLERIQNGLFDNIRKLHVLNLEHNPITTIGSNAFSKLQDAHIYLGEALYKQWNNADWAKSTNATLCKEEYIMGVCRFCVHNSYLDHFASKETCNNPNDPGKPKDILLQKNMKKQLWLMRVKHLPKKKVEVFKE